jgi:acyl carrier protein
MDQTITNNETIFVKIAEHLAETANVPLEKITPESKFQDLGMDSLDALALISDLEEEYKIKIPNQEVLKIQTVGQAVEAMVKRIK